MTTPTKPATDAFVEAGLLTRGQPWRLELDDSLILPEYRTPEMTAALEVTAYTPEDMYLAVHWLQCLEMELILKPFCAALCPATFTQIVRQAYGGHLVERTPEGHTLNLYRHWEGGFRWEELTDEPYSTSALMAQVQQRELAPKGLGELLLVGLAQDADRGWITKTPAHMKHRREWDAYFALCGDTVETWGHLLNHVAQTNDTPLFDGPSPEPWHRAWRIAARGA